MSFFFLPAAALFVCLLCSYYLSFICSCLFVYLVRMECKLSELQSLREQCSRLQRELAESEAQNAKLTGQYQEQGKELKQLRDEVFNML